MDYLELNSLRNNKDNLTNFITNFHSSLIPVIYRRQSSNQVIVNTFQINIYMHLSRVQNVRISYAEIIGGYNSEIKSPYGKVGINVSYDLFQSFIFYGLNICWYVLYSVIFLGILSVLLLLLTKKLKIRNLNKKVKLIVAPAIKGISLSLITAGSFIILMHLISSYSHFSAIIATFDSDLSGKALQFNNIGRYGLTLFITGLYILTSGIKQIFKVNEQQQLKIAFEDDKIKFENEQQLKAQIQFSRSNLFSKRKYLLNGTIVNVSFALAIFFTSINSSKIVSAMFLLLIFPWLANGYYSFQIDFLFKNSLLACSSVAAGTHLAHLFIVKNQNIYEITYMYLCYYIGYMVIYPLDLIFRGWLLRKLQASRQNSKIAQILCSFSFIQKKIQIQKSQSQYQQGLSYSFINVGLLIKIMLFPFILVFIYISQNYNQISKLFMITDQSILVTLILCILGVIVQIYTVLLMIQILKKYFGVRIQQVMKYNSFRFKRTKFRWMNDVFAESKYIREQFRQYEKFAFSSQLYFVISVNTIGLYMIFLGMIIMVQIKYLPFYDPAALVIFVTVWVLGEVLSIIVSVVGIKLKLYQKKGNQGIKQKLAKMDKYLKPDDKKQYLQLDGVKDFFLISNKEWIINNLHKIFTKEDLKAKNYQLINKYKDYKRNFKRKQIDQKKQLNQLRLLSNTTYQSPSITEQPFLVVKNKRIFRVAKPIILYWHYLAKQNLYLKNIVACVKKQKIKSVCQYCNMDIYLQAAQKYGFHDIVNSYRVQNVGKMFDQQAFLQYYRINQQYVTICLQCKQKNLHLHNKIDKKSVASKLMFCWLMKARGNLLHNKNNLIE